MRMFSFFGLLVLGSAAIMFGEDLLGIVLYLCAILIIAIQA